MIYTAFGNNFIYENGNITAGDYEAIYQWLAAEYRLIFGADINLDAATQDGQWISVQALAIREAIVLMQAIANSYSPSYASGEALDRVVSINGIARNAATNSTVDVVIIGQAGTNIINGQVGNEAGDIFLLPASVVIPLSGSITVTATAQETGAIDTPANSVNQILTPTRGWQSVNNITAGTAGEAVETDAELRTRQAASVALPSLSIIDGLYGALIGLSGVTECKIYENATSVTDALGIPEHSIAVVIEGGNVQDIADTIRVKKSAGCNTFGVITAPSEDIQGFPIDISFSRPIAVDISVEITITALQGYVFSDDAIKSAVLEYIDGLRMGDDIYISRLFSPINAISTTFDVSLIRLARGVNPLAASNIIIAYNETATIDISDITVITV